MIFRSIHIRQVFGSPLELNQSFLGDDGRSNRFVSQYYISNWYIYLLCVGDFRLMMPDVRLAYVALLSLGEPLVGAALLASFRDFVGAFHFDDCDCVI